MPIGLVDEHDQLRASARRWLDKNCTSAQLRVMIESADAFSEFWTALAEHGWLSAHIDESYGGQGFRAVEVAVVLEELGRALVPGPVLATVSAGWLIQECGSQASRDEYLPALADGSRIATVAVNPGSVVATEVEGGYELTGAVRPIVGARHASLVLLPFERESHSEWYIVDVDDAEQKLLESIDPTRHVWALELDGTFVPYERRLKNLTTDRVRDVAATFAAAEAVGIAQWCVDTAVDYAKTREQFGRPIGQFQAVKHRCADMLTALEQATCTAWDAALALGEPDESPVSAATAGLFATESAFACAKDCIQTLGGVGCTWDHDAHLYLKRATSLRQLLGGPAAWSTEIARRGLDGKRRHLRVELPAEAEIARDEVGIFLEEIRELDKEEQRRRIVDAGYMAPHWPKPWGQDADPTRQLVIQEEFKAADVDVPQLLVGAWVAPTLIQYGSEEQVERFLPPTLYGDIQWCQMFSEPGAGSDLASLSTKAVKVEGGWSLTGQKVWTTSAQVADFAICLARTDPDAPKHRGISYFLIDMRSDGLDIRPLRELTGLAGFNEVFLTDVFVPDEMLIGEPGQGWQLARTTLANERVAMDAGATMMGLPEILLSMVEASGKTDTLMLDRLGRVLADAHTLALLNYRKLLTALHGAEPGPESSVLKLLRMEHNQEISECALEIIGPDATVSNGHLSYWIDLFLSMRASTIAGGTSEVQRNVIAERILGLPHDP